MHANDEQGSLGAALSQVPDQLPAGDALLGAVFDLLPVAVWIADRDGQVLNANRAAKQIWQGSRYLGAEDYPGYKAWSVDTNEPIGPNDWGATRALRLGEMPRRELIRIQCCDDSVKTVIHWAAPIRSAAGEILGAVVVNEDVTALQRTHDELRDAVREREEVLSIVTHDLRTPLTSIALLAATLEHRAGRLSGSDSLRAPITGLTEATHQMSALVEDLLIAAIPHRTRLGLNIVPVKALQLLKKAARAARPIYAREGLVLRVKAPAKLPALHVDADRILRVFANLLGNAVKFTRAPGAVVLHAQPQSAGVVFSISNTGTPLSEPEIRSIFRPLWQSGQGGAGSAGLGLSICRSVVQAHGGSIWADREDGQRVRVSFFLPASTPAAHDAAFSLQQAAFAPAAPAGAAPSNSVRMPPA